MVNVDGLALQRAAQVVGEHLHVARQHHQLHAFLLDQIQQLGLGSGFIVRRHGDVMKRNVGRSGQLVVVAVVGHNRFDLQRQQVRAVAK